MELAAKKSLHYPPVEVGRSADLALPRQLADRNAGFAFFEDRDDM